MINLLGLSGSLRKASYNTALLHAAAALMPAGSALSVHTIHGFSLYNEDDENAHGIPSLVQEMKTAITAADGLLLSTPEYNNSIPGPFKNAIDWLSRPGEDIPRVFGGKPVAIMGASPGGFGTLLSQNAWLPVLRAFGTKPWFGGRLIVPRAYEVFDDSGQIVDPALREQLRKFMEGFIQFTTEQKFSTTASTAFIEQAATVVTK